MCLITEVCPVITAHSRQEKVPRRRVIWDSSWGRRDREPTVPSNQRDLRHAARGGCVVVVVAGGQRALCALCNTCNPEGGRRLGGPSPPSACPPYPRARGRQLRPLEDFQPQVLWPAPGRPENDHLAGVWRCSLQAPAGPRTPRCAAPSRRVSPGRTARGEGRGEGAGRLGGPRGEAVRPPSLGGEARVPGPPHALLSAEPGSLERKRPAGPGEMRASPWERRRRRGGGRVSGSGRGTPKPRAPGCGREDPGLGGAAWSALS
ncbi:translation initiation factor IF-2-like [Psammomys obesus]|uniref:translation initiation factor IF-2-like n=1 Tax=Psammomys obesus TaxID=48139 RepID=UPI002452F3EA|nr:translation initiation factor IF-2-like [Psammomys obesus]